MANPTPTYTPQDAVNLVKSFVHGAPIDPADTTTIAVCDMILSMIWVFYPWYWTITSFTGMAVTNASQDIVPASADQSQLLRPLKMRLVRTDISPNEFRELTLMANLAPELTWQLGLESNRLVGWFPSGPFFRLNNAMSVGTGQTYQLQGEYQKVPTRITDQNMTVAFPFPDFYFNVFVEGVKWKIYQLTDDPRAGGIAMNKNGNVMKGYTGQYGIFVEQLNAMARTEDLSSGDEFRFPESGFGTSHVYWPGMFGM